MPDTFNDVVVGYARQVGVAQAGENHCFETKLPRVFIGGEQVFFNGYFHAQVFVHGAVNRPHATLAEDIHDAVTPV